MLEQAQAGELHPSEPAHEHHRDEPV